MSKGIRRFCNIDDEIIWKPIIEKIKTCLQVWKTRNLTFTGKTLIVKNLIISKTGYEIEMRGIPDNYAKEINNLI